MRIDKDGHLHTDLDRSRRGIHLRPDLQEFFNRHFHSFAVNTEFDGPSSIASSSVDNGNGSVTSTPTKSIFLQLLMRVPVLQIAFVNVNATYVVTMTLNHGIVTNSGGIEQLPTAYGIREHVSENIQSSAFGGKPSTSTVAIERKLEQVQKDSSKVKRLKPGK